MKTAMRWGLVLGTGLALSVSLAGCELGGAGMAPKDRPEGEATEAGSAAATSARIVERDVEAPEVFSASEAGLWDGRPSLGGVWVAHPNVKDPERVIIRNPANGKFVIGALFRRERDNPGPTLQVSSDAAAALDMLAGAPTKLSVVALKREEKPEAAPAKPAPAKPATPPKGAAAEEIAAAPLDAPASGKPGAKPAKPGTKPPADIAASAGAAIAAADGKPAAAAAPAKPATAKPTPAATTGKAPSGKAYVQIGIFSVEANAKRAADQMKAAGIATTIRASKMQDKPYWSVVAGPAGSAAERAALLAKIKGLGYADAYAVSK